MTEVELRGRDAISRETPALWLGLARHFPDLVLPGAAASANARFESDKLALFNRRSEQARETWKVLL
jgi:hypothetical protein